MREVVATRQTIGEGLRKIGLEYGDVVLVRSSLKSIGIQEEYSANTLIHALCDVVGPEGTIVGLAFNSSRWFPTLHKKEIINLQTEPSTGGFAKALVNWPGSFRSKHPTNSFVALGGSARRIIDRHDEKATCFFPIEQLLSLNAKMILIGCVKTSPGFSTVHFVQENLGLATRCLLKGFLGVYFRKGNDVRLFKPKDFPGCSRGFYKFYSHYIYEEKLHIGYVGNAYSILIGARDAYDTEYNILKKTPTFALCDNPGCFMCRGTRLYNLSDMPKFYIFQAPKKIYNLIVKQT
jgi:aminoglycoside 3-N-acetyltransferase